MVAVYHKGMRMTEAMSRGRCIGDMRIAVIERSMFMLDHVRVVPGPQARRGNSRSRSNQGEDGGCGGQPGSRAATQQSLWQP